MPEIYCVRANNGEYENHFIKGEYAAIGWLQNTDLSSIENREQIKDVYEKNYPDDKSSYVIGQQVGQISRFLLEIQPGDYIITLPNDTDYLRYGVVDKEKYFFEPNPKDGCPYVHRIKVNWKEKLLRSSFSIPIQYSLRASLTVFKVKRSKNSFFETIGQEDLISNKETKARENNTETVLNRLLELDFTEFEILITNLLSSIGFEAEHVGKVGDGGVDARGELDLFNLAKVKLFVQAKRYRLDRRIKKKDILKLRQNIPHNAQGAFITTCDYNKEALETATEPEFPRIGTINGNQLVDLLAEKWDEIDDELKDKLSLKKGLIFG